VVVSQAGYPSRSEPFRAIFVHELCQKLLRRGFKLAVATADDGYAKEAFQGVSVYRIKHQFAVHLARILSLEKPHIVHIHFADSAIGGVLVGRLFLRKTIIHCHRDDVDPYRKLRIRLLRSLAFKLCNSVIAVSESTSLLAQQCGASQPKITIIYNSANEELYVNQVSRKDARRKLGLASDVPIFLSVGHLIERKGFDFLIEGSSGIERPFLVIIVGEGSEEDRLRGLIASLGLESKVKVWGSASMEELVNLYKAADVFVHPSMHEGHSMVLVEAMASGLPIIATQVPGNVETVQDGVTGLLVPPRDPVSLRIAMTALLEHPEERERLGLNAFRVYFENFSETVQMQRLVQVYHSLLGLRA